jgi:hypothetical protein
MMPGNMQKILAHCSCRIWKTQHPLKNIPGSSSPMALGTGRNQSSRLKHTRAEKSREGKGDPGKVPAAESE